jgi:hypothetical protein
MSQTAADVRSGNLLPSTTSNGVVRFAMFTRRARLNHESMFAFLGAMIVLALVFIIFHRTESVVQYFGAKKPSFSGGLARFDMPNLMLLFLILVLLRLTT